MRTLRSLWLAPVLALLAACSGADKPDATYYLVRHAEKVLDVKDPPLTPAGEQRAEDLAEFLSDIELTAIYSSDYQRTRDTAVPASTAQNISVQLYDPRDLTGFAAQLLSQDGDILVVGHSNTTPPLAEALGADPGEPIVEATEYNRLYVITRTGKKIEGEIHTYGK